MALQKPVASSTLFDAVMNVLSSANAHPRGSVNALQVELPTEADLSLIAGARVLLVEDNELNTEVATDLLTEFAVNVDTAENGAIAIEKLQVVDYDLVLMDMQMPVMDGVTATIEIRKQPRFAALPIVAMTANVMAVDRERCLNAGMNDHLVKPIDPDDLLAALRRWIKPALRQVKATEADATPTAIVTAVGDEGQKALLSSDTLARLRQVIGLDVDAGLRLTRNREKLYLSLLGKYVTNQRDFAVQLEAALSSSDWETAVRLAHTLKGVSGQIGAASLSTMGQLIEHALKQREPPEVLAKLNEQIAEMLRLLIAGITAAMPGEVSVPLLASSINVEELREICQRLQEQITTSDFASGHLIDAYEPLLRVGLGSRFEKIRTSIQDFDFEQAATELDAAIKSLG